MEDKKYILKTSNGEIICQKMVVAENTLTRMKGLMFSDEIPDKGDGFLIKRCNSIHTFFMNYPLDVIFLDKNLKVVKIIENLQPWKLTLFYLRATQTLELRGNHLKGHLSRPLQTGEQLEAICIN